MVKAIGTKVQILISLDFSANVDYMIAWTKLGN